MNLNFSNYQEDGSELETNPHWQLGGTQHMLHRRPIIRIDKPPCVSKLLCVIIDNLNIAVSRVGETIFRNGMVEILLNPISLPLHQIRVKTLVRSHFHDRENWLGLRIKYKAGWYVCTIVVTTILIFCGAEFVELSGNLELWLPAICKKGCIFKKRLAI